ncbi:MAG TPA: ATP-dependent Clp protease adaptor ClpS [Prolixibacteraceae bacterium]|nr:ATP-dependent Clp protease adaptor ClpS [Prolixibacteraceae bacterium]
MTREKTHIQPGQKDLYDTEDGYNLILMNDDVHSFDYVIDALVEICHHTTQQATQCTLLAHYHGSCEIKKGTRQELNPLRKALLQKELRATIG